MTTNQKIKTLTQNNEDREWYPTTDEILAAMNKDLHQLFDKHGLAKNFNLGPRDKLLSYTWSWDEKAKKDRHAYYAQSFLDVGAGDGRVLDALTGVNGDIRIDRKYGIEIAKAQADDLINRGVFIIGRDFFKCSLTDKWYSVIFSNPPYSQFKAWAEKLFKEANFAVMYLVLPIRWKGTLDKQCGMELYDVKPLGEFDFSHADRTARARVNLIRVTHKWVKVEDSYRGQPCGSHFEFGNKNEPDSFERWIAEKVGTFKGKPDEGEDAKALKLKGSSIDELIGGFEQEAKALFDLFKSIGDTPFRIIQALNIDRKSILEIIREDIRALKKRYWRAAFDKLEAVNSRLTQCTRNKLLSEMEEFNTLDFNEDNLYSIIVWVIKHFNEYADEQLLSAFDAMTSQDYIKAYKSNIRWVQDNWRYTGKGKPEKYKLDYRLVVRCYKSCRYDSCVIDDFIVVCRTLGFYISEGSYIDGEAYGEEQRFYTVEGRLAFTARLYKNGNAHLKVNQELMMKFNIEVAKLRKWVNNHAAIQNEFDLSAEEAIKLWNEPGLLKIGKQDLKLLCYENQCA
jgi:hypothetical protein